MSQLRKRTPLVSDLVDLAKAFQVKIKPKEGIIFKHLEWDINQVLGKGTKTGVYIHLFGDFEEGLQVGTILLTNCLLESDVLMFPFFLDEFLQIVADFDAETLILNQMLTEYFNENREVPSIKTMNDWRKAHGFDSGKVRGRG